jgi:basic membrane protein A
VYHWEVILEEILDKIGDGTLGGEIYSIDFENEGLVLEYNDAFEVPDDVKAKADEAIDAIKDGSVTTK